ncbi:DUF1294 domain-containing protein [Galbitalea soli]|uniref:DUF1294 domain-containing protein n=1 Tax=Galbitalea soli TaxID=1268042 RepID=A0A7C9PNG0_9MICO|nr:cold shock and DUF1294 domain-containing protein [Galbitalea soli]NEM91605.1 DUF1294 domain-containing protein [Galbitalea soli]NYJ30299.1 uncharacterized membrane protein YsdA (DUF1294 family)/cold shock CspA family protein [Galbitalea soli]
MTPRSAHLEGVLVSWNAERGFGFIAPADGGKDVFAHIRAFPRGTEVPTVGEQLLFEVETTADGKDRAARVLPRADALAGEDVALGAPARGEERRLLAPVHTKPGNASYFALPAFLVVYLVVAHFWHLPLWVAALYLVMSILTFVMYRADKAAAIRGSWRVPEESLLLVGLAAGWPGAIVAQQVLRHKTTKAGFRRRFWGSVALNVFLFVGLSSPWFEELVARVVRVLVGH